MATSQNGWTAITSGTDARLTALSWVTGRVLAGSVHQVLDHVCRRFHAEVEPIDTASSWGWAHRPITGSSSLSNHASGTAIDLNAPRHPLGTTGTFTVGQASTIRVIVAAVNAAGGGPVVRWGGDYPGRKDEMHLEIVGTAERVATAAQALAGAAAFQGTPGVHTGRLTADGNFELIADGVLGTATIGRWQQVMGTPVDGVLSTPTSTLVLAVQRMLIARGLGVGPAGADGRGISSNAASRTPRTDTVAALQRHLGTTVDGRLDRPSAAVTALQHRLNAAHTGSGQF